MAEITLEKIDIIRDRTGASYTEAKEALEQCEGNVVDALVYLEGKEEAKANDKHNMEDFYATKDEFKDWLKETINKGNVTRLKIKKGERVIVDIPVNAGIAAGVFALIWPPLIGIGLLTAVITKITIEITKNDGSVEVVNTVIKNAVDNVKSRAQDIKEDIENKVKKNDEKEEGSVYQYTVRFDEEKVEDENLNEDSNNINVEISKDDENKQ